APSQFVTIEELNIHYVQDGHGPDLLLVHGFAASTYSWYTLWPELKKSFRLTAIDLPGFGLSEKSERYPYTLDREAMVLGEFIRRLQLEPVDIVAWSMGAEISLWLAKQRPEL